MKQDGIFKTSDGCAIAYTLHGAGSPGGYRMVLIHSLGLDASIWDDVAPKLTPHAEILTYDCRGHGRSGRQAIPFTTELFARDLAELLDHIGWQTAVVAGCSMGGCVAQAFAALYPSRASAAGLIDTTAWYGEDAPATWRKRAAEARSQGLGARREFQTARWFSDRFRAAHPETVDAFLRIYTANDLDCHAATCAMLGDADLRPQLTSLRLPVAVIVGEEDYATPVAHARQLHEAIPLSTLTIIPGARHLTPVECPDEIAAQLVTLAGRIRSHQMTSR
jgi:3-oxoadipate enol-lactonase